MSQVVSLCKIVERIGGVHIQIYLKHDLQFVMGDNQVLFYPKKQQASPS